MILRTLVISVCLMPVCNAYSDVQEFTSRPLWESAIAGDYTTIPFTGFQNGTQITNQYGQLGITFTNLAFIFMSSGLINDGWGLHGPGGLHFMFSAPQQWVSIDHPGVAQFQLFSHGVLLYTSSLFFHGGTGNFSGLISTVPFDEVFIYKPPPYDNQVIIDDLHWGAPVPAPGALSLFTILALGSRRRR